jgi:glycerol-3-phosphate dehydrogenase
MSTQANPRQDNAELKVLETEVLIIGGGLTGAGIMRDLSLRGIRCLLIDKHDLCAGASGGNHGLLHSGARYVTNDLQAAVECRQESDILKQLAPQCIENTGALFVGVEDDDPGFGAQFPARCTSAGIVCVELSPAEARTMEPHLTEKIHTALLLPDATVDPFRLALENVAQAQLSSSSAYRPHTEVLSFRISHGTIDAAICRDNRTGDLLDIRAHQVVNAGGAWAMNIARIAGCSDVNLLYSKGTLLISHDRLTDRVIHRLRPPGDGDIVVPGGTVSVLGTTSIRVDELDSIVPTVEEVNTNIREGSAMVPALVHARYIRAFSRVRPLLQPGAEASDREVTRGYALLDHRSKLTNFCTITGGKLTTYRLMAERASDLVAERLSNTVGCKTRELPMQDGEACRWTEPGASPKYWFQANNPDDSILCECEMVPQSAIDEIIKCAPSGGEEMTLEGIALRSRVGKGPCQGSFCGMRIASYLYDRGYYRDKTGLDHMRKFFNERFKGLRPIIWGRQMAQMELSEALHCGLLGLDQANNMDESAE